jgi:predicted phage terminase large subunit-like protein
MRNSANARLYMNFSYDVRAILDTAAFKRVFPKVQLADNRQNVTGWGLENVSQLTYFGSGVGGSVIGLGASGLAITDDLYKGLEAARSEVMNGKVMMWLDSAHNSRMERGCARIDIGTRWSLTDVIGTNTENGRYDKSIIVPAMINDKSFCEDVMSTESYEQTRKLMLSEVWLAEYMQQPVEMEGMLFKKSDLQRFKRAEYKTTGREAVLAYADIADEGTDYFAMPIGEIYKDRVFITDVLFTRDNIDVTLPLCVGMLTAAKVDYVRVETNNQGSVFIKMLREKIDPGKVYPVTNTTNKLTRIILQYAFIKQHFVFLDDTEYELGSPYDLFMRQLFSFMKDGGSTHDDAPDSISGLSLMVSSFLPRLFN